jgi:phospholipid/cholesterol/gamma-HCH transport system ATP-binding protein
MTATLVGTPSPAPLIEVSHIQTRFGSASVHEDVSLTINKDEVFAIAGGNGCGKSVLMREMILLQKPTAGEIQIFGHNIRSLDDAETLTLRRRCGVLFQYGALFSSLNVA